MHNGGRIQWGVRVLKRIVSKSQTCIQADHKERSHSQICRQLPWPGRESNRKEENERNVRDDRHFALSSQLVPFLSAVISVCMGMYKMLLGTQNKEMLSRRIN